MPALNTLPYQVGCGKQFRYRYAPEERKGAMTSLDQSLPVEKASPAPPPFLADRIRGAIWSQFVGGKAFSAAWRDRLTARDVIRRDVEIIVGRAA